MIITTTVSLSPLNIFEQQVFLFGQHKRYGRNNKLIGDGIRHL